jgi:hypothetical protein
MFEGGRRADSGRAMLVLALAISSTSACGSDGAAPQAGAGNHVGVSVGGRPWLLSQGEIVFQDALPNGQPGWQVVMSSKEHDRCSLNVDAIVTGDTSAAFMTVSVPVEPGHYDLKALGGAAITNAPLNVDAIPEGSLEVVAVDPATVTLRIEGTEAVSHRVVSQTFVVDSCGYSGQDVVTFERCDLPTADLSSGSFPPFRAVSPAGRVVVPTGNGALSVLARHDDGAGHCQYQLDPAYGTDGVVHLPKPARETAFDAAERLYVTTGLVLQDPQQPGSLFRIAPGPVVSSCRYTGMADANLTDDAPDHLLVLPDGTSAYLAWRGQEWQLDLASPSLGARDLPCDLVARDPMAALYTDALSADASGLIFLRDLNGRRRAAVTDFGLVPQRYFGGTPSGAGEQGFQGVDLFARCPAGFCAAQDGALKVFSADGAFVQMIQLENELGARALATYVVAGNGDGYLRATLGSDTPATDVVYRLRAK